MLQLTTLISADELMEKIMVCLLIVDRRKEIKLMKGIDFLASGKLSILRLKGKNNWIMVSSVHNPGLQTAGFSLGKKKKAAGDF